MPRAEDQQVPFRSSGRSSILLTEVVHLSSFPSGVLFLFFFLVITTYFLSVNLTTTTSGNDSMAITTNILISAACMYPSHHNIPKKQVKQKASSRQPFCKPNAQMPCLPLLFPQPKIDFLLSLAPVFGSCRAEYLRTHAEVPNATPTFHLLNSFLPPNHLPHVNKHRIINEILGQGFSILQRHEWTARRPKIGHKVTDSSVLTASSDTIENNNKGD